MMGPNDTSFGIPFVANVVIAQPPNAANAWELYE